MALATLSVMLERDVRHHQEWLEHSESVRLEVERVRSSIRRTEADLLDTLRAPGDLSPRALAASRADMAAREQKLLHFVTADSRLRAQMEEMAQARKTFDATVDRLLAEDSRTNADPAIADRLHETRRAAIALASNHLDRMSELELERDLAQDKDLDQTLSRLGVALLSMATIGTLVVALGYIMWRRESRDRQHAQEQEAQARESLQKLNGTLAEQVRERTRQLQAEREVAERHAENRLRLSRQLLQVQESERRSLARELHDDLGQQLAALKMNVQTLLHESDSRHHSRLQDSVQIADAVIGQVRERAMSLRPALLDELGLGAALQWHAKKQEERFAARIVIDFDLGNMVPSDEWSCNVYRIAQEAINNALRHGKAKEVVVQVFGDGSMVTLVIGDNGVGLAPRPADSPGMGLHNIAERVELLGGTMCLQSTPGGTELRATWPCAALHGVSQPPIAPRAHASTAEA